MANNENVNKVVYGNTTLIDLTGDSVTPEKLLEGETAHDKSGALIVGIAKLQPSIPNGKTVTPINDVTIWQKCAGIANPTYTTLAEVLADTGILQTLMASDNAVDYLVRSKQFIGNEALVPTMTSNTTPSGVVSASSYSTNYEAWKAFNMSEYYGWSPSSSDANNPYIQYEFPASKSIYKVVAKMTGNTTSITYTAKILCGSTELDDISVPFDGQTHEKTFAPTDGQTFKLRYDSRTGSSAWTNGSGLKVQFYSYGITANQNAMTYIGLNNYASNTLLADSDWLNGIANSAYIESVMNVKVPTMTSNTTPSGEASASSVKYDSTPAWKAFDGGDTTSWIPNGTTGNITYAYPSNSKILIAKGYVYAETGVSLVSHSVTFQYSTDGSNYTDVSTQTVNSANFAIASTSIPTARYFRINYNSANVVNGSTYYIKLTELQFYGREDV